MKKITVLIYLVKLRLTTFFNREGDLFRLTLSKKWNKEMKRRKKKEILDRTAVTSTQHRSSFPPTFNTTVSIFGSLDRSEVGCWNSSNRHFAQNQFCEIMQKNAWTCVGHTYYTVEIDYCQNKCTKGKKIGIHSNSFSSMIRFTSFLEILALNLSSCVSDKQQHFYYGRLLLLMKNSAKNSRWFHCCWLQLSKQLQYEMF